MTAYTELADHPSALEIVQTVLAGIPSIASLTLCKHGVLPTWHASRKTVASPYQTVARDPELVELSRDAFLGLTLQDLSAERDIVSVSSLVALGGDRFRHLALMNVHSDCRLDAQLVSERFGEMFGQGPTGYLVNSGRSYHFYGIMLLKHAEWLRFLAACLFYDDLVSRDYIAYRLMAGYCTLRLNSPVPEKPTMPYAIGFVTGKGDGVVRLGQ